MHFRIDFELKFVSKSKRVPFVKSIPRLSPKIDNEMMLTNIKVIDNIRAYLFLSRKLILGFMLIIYSIF